MISVGYTRAMTPCLIFHGLLTSRFGQFIKIKICVVVVLVFLRPFDTFQVISGAVSYPIYTIPGQAS